MDDYYESEQYFDDREQLLHDMNAALEPVARKFVRMHELHGKYLFMSDPEAAKSEFEIAFEFWLYHSDWI